MKLTRIQIDRFGLWRNLDLALNPNGLSVLFGPNEAGKTTLLRFIRGVLYGFPLSELDGRDDRDPVRGGSLDVQSHGHHCRITRRRTHGSSPQLSLTGWDRAVPTGDAVREMLAGTSRSVFQNVFAIGLHELQQLASLQGDDVAERVYGISLGAEGRQLLSAVQSTRTAQRRLFDAERKAGRLFDLLQRDLHGDPESRTLAKQREEFDRLLRERQRLTTVIREMQSRQTGMQSQLRGHRYLQRIWGPWQQVRDYRNQLDALPDLDDFPADGVSRLRQLESDIESESRCRQSLQHEIEQRETRRNAILPDASLRQNMSALRRIVGERGRLRRLIDERDKARDDASNLRGEFQELCRIAGPDWNAERAETADCSPAAQFRLLHAARSFQAAGVRRGRFRRLLQNATKSHRKLTTKIEQQLAELGAESIDVALTDQARRIEKLNEARRLRLEIDEAERKRDILRTAANPQRLQPIVPEWFRRVLWFFGIVGGLVAATGLITTFTINAWSGLVLSLAGFTGLGIAWGLQYHAELSHGDGNSRQQTELLAIEQKLVSTRSAWQALLRELRIPESATINADVLADEQNRLTELKSLQRRQKRADRQRKRLSKLRHRFSGIKQEFGEARQQWCEMLMHAGIPETLRINEAFDKWQEAFELQQTLAKWKAAEALRDRRQRQIDRVGKRIERTAGKLGWKLAGRFEPLTLLDQWHRQLQTFDTSREECRTLKEEIATRRREAAAYAERLRELKREHAALLAKAGAADRDEFERRAASIGQRAELQELLELAEEELREAAATEPELAVVEEDLLQFNDEENRGCIDVLESELADIARDLERTHEELGGVKRAITELETDRRGTQRRFQQARQEGELVESLQMWMADDIALQALMALRSRFERERQPAVLEAASNLMRQLTDGRYVRVWSPLGRRRICLDDSRGRTWNLDELSGGTREQVFLAVRFALIEEFASNGVDLPIILDDVLVNFDQQRTETAIDTLFGLTESGRQIIFLTCHEHIATMFRNRDVQPVTLPAPQSEFDRRIAG